MLRYEEVFVTARSPETTPAALYPESSFQFNPLMHVRVTFVRFMQGLFASAPQGRYRWQEDVANTEIFISDEGVLSPEVVARVPAISISRGPISFYSMGIDDFDSYDPRVDKKTKTVLVPGTITINVCARLDLESEHVAYVVAQHIWLLRHLLMKQGLFDVGRGIQVGSPSAAGSVIADERGDEFRCTPVSVPYQFGQTSAYTPLNQEIANNIETRMRLGTPPPFFRSVPGNNINQGHEQQVAVETSFPEAFAPQALDLQRSSLQIQPHPLNPAVNVNVRVVRPNTSR